MFDNRPPSHQSCDPSCPSRAKCSLTHQVKYYIHSGNPLSNGSGIHRLRPKQVLKARPSYMKKLSKCLSMPSTPVSMPCTAKHAPTASWGASYDWKRRRGLALPMLLHATDATQKWTAAALQPVSGTALRNTSEGNLHSGQNFRQHTRTCDLKERRPDNMVADGLQPVGRLDGQGRGMSVIGEKDLSGRSVGGLL